MKTAAQKLHDLGAPAVIIKGGNRLSQDKAVDVFYDGQTFTLLENPVIQGQNAGAGCTFASSIASHLVKGDELLPAVESSFLIDLLSGYPQWMFFSLVNHGLQGFFAGFKGKAQWLGLILATIAMVGGYALGSTLMNGWAAALPEILPNFMQNIVGMIVGFVLSQSIKKIK